MTEEEYFRKTYPDSCYGDKPLSPYWDFFQDGVEFGERQSENKIADIKANCDLAIEGRDIKIRELEQQLAQLKKDVIENESDCAICGLRQENAELEKESNRLFLEGAKRVEELEQQIEKMKRCEICKHSGTYLPICYSNEPCKNKDKWEIKEND